MLKAARQGRWEQASMIDLAFVVVTVLFFLLSWAYVRACERV